MNRLDGIPRERERYLPGNRLTMFSSGGEAFEAMLGAIAGAKETVHLETYRLASDKTGHKFARALEERARGGARVRLIFDSLGSRGIAPDMLTRLRNAGVQLLEYHPIAPWRSRWALSRRDHRKILLLDGAAAFAGSLNISDVHAPAEDGGGGWHDAHVKVEGPAAAEMERIFRDLWERETGRWFPVPGAVPHQGAALVWPVANMEFLQRYRIRAAYLSAIRQAKSEVLLAHAYFLPDARFRRALYAAARRGVSVKVLVPGTSDVPPVWYASRAYYGALLRRGIRLLEWQGPVLHSKIAAVDRAWAAIGSYNLDHRSLRLNLELNLHVLDGDFAALVAGRVEKDMRDSPEILIADWRRRGWHERMLERFFSLFRYLL